MPTRPDDPHGLSVHPFRGLRYAPDRVSGLAEVTSPPYDVLGVDEVLALESTDPHNVVRLILPRDEESGPEGRYEHAARILRSWQAEGVLLRDARAGVYVYEQAREGRVLQRGLLGSVGLRAPADRVVLPHEDVMPGLVADRLELMRAARANVEPILLMYDGEGGQAAEVVERVARTDPLVSASDRDGISHRLWQVTSVDDLRALSDDLSGRQALIADGHHRYAAYRSLQAELRAQSGAGAWDSGLALLVDLRAHPPTVGAIHRTVDGIDLDSAVRLADGLFEVEPLSSSDTAGLLAETAPGRVVVVGDGRAVALTAADATKVRQLVTERHPQAWGGLDSAVLHVVLAEQVWRVGDERIGYHHDAEQAVQHGRGTGGIAVLLAPVDVGTVLSIAAQGVLMPRKSTSFGPKPRTGFVLRTFEDD